MYFLVCTFDRAGKPIRLHLPSRTATWAQRIREFLPALFASTLSHFNFMNISSETFYYFQRTRKPSLLRKRFLMFTKQSKAWVFFFPSDLQCPWMHLETMPGSQVGSWCALLVWKRPKCPWFGTFFCCHQGIKWPVSHQWEAICWQVQPFTICPPLAGSRPAGLGAPREDCLWKWRC